MPMDGDTRGTRYGHPVQQLFASDGVSSAGSESEIGDKLELLVGVHAWTIDRRY